MPRRDPDLRLRDIAEAIDRIMAYTASHSLESFQADSMAVDVVVRNLEGWGKLRDTSTRKQPRSSP